MDNNKRYTKEGQMNIIPARPDENESEDYYSAEFQIHQSKIMYRFKLRKSQTESMFVVVKEGSRALENIKEGDIYGGPQKLDNVLSSKSK